MISKIVLLFVLLFLVVFFNRAESNMLIKSIKHLQLSSDYIERVYKKLVYEYINRLQMKIDNKLVNDNDLRDFQDLYVSLVKQKQSHSRAQTVYWYLRQG